MRDAGCKRSHRVEKFRFSSGLWPSAASCALSSTMESFRIITISWAAASTMEITQETWKPQVHEIEEVQL